MQRLLWLRSMGFRARELSSCGFWALEHRLNRAQAPKLSCSEECGNLPGSGIEPVSVASTGTFFTTEPPGKSERDKNLWQVKFYGAGPGRCMLCSGWEPSLHRPILPGGQDTPWHHLTVPISYLSSYLPLLRIQPVLPNLSVFPCTVSFPPRCSASFSVHQRWHVWQPPRLGWELTEAASCVSSESPERHTWPKKCRLLSMPLCPFSSQLYTHL